MCREAQGSISVSPGIGRQFTVREKSKEFVSPGMFPSCFSVPMPGTCVTLPPVLNHHQSVSSGPCEIFSPSSPLPPGGRYHPGLGCSAWEKADSWTQRIHIQALQKDILSGSPSRTLSPGSGATGFPFCNLPCVSSSELKERKRETCPFCRWVLDAGNRQSWWGPAARERPRERGR